MTRWERRIERARELAERYPNAAEMLRFYREIAIVQSGAGTLPALLEVMRRLGTPVLRERARYLAAHPGEWGELQNRRDDPVDGFFLRVLEQPRLEQQALESGVDRSVVQRVCPFCSARPVVAVLRPEGDGGRRTLLCGQCFTEWEFRRLLCPNCGEEDREKLPVFTAPEFPHTRVEACETCRHYIKAVDMTRDGTAVPEVDEIAALPLDLWAMEQGYEGIGPNLFG